MLAHLRCRLRFEIAEIPPQNLVQRVWVKRFVDGNDLLVGETVIYKEIIGSHWQGFGGADSSSSSISSAASLPLPKDGPAYPHRAPVPTSAKSVAGLATAPVAGSANAPAPATASPGFTQPGVRAPAGEMAPVPATSSGTTSMPQ